MKRLLKVFCIISCLISTSVALGDETVSGKVAASELSQRLLHLNSTGRNSRGAPCNIDFTNLEESEGIGEFNIRISTELGANTNLNFKFDQRVIKRVSGSSAQFFRFYRIDTDKDIDPEVIFSEEEGIDKVDVMVFHDSKLENCKVSMLKE